MLRTDIRPGSFVEWRAGARGRWRKGMVRIVEHRGDDRRCATTVTISALTRTGYPEVELSGDAVHDRMRIVNQTGVVR